MHNTLFPPKRLCFRLVLLGISCLPTLAGADEEPKKSRGWKTTGNVRRVQHQQPGKTGKPQETNSIRVTKSTLAKVTSQSIPLDTGAAEKGTSVVQRKQQYPAARHRNPALPPTSRIQPSERRLPADFPRSVQNGVRNPPRHIPAPDPSSAARQVRPLPDLIEPGRTIQVPILQPPPAEQAGTVNFSSHQGRITLVTRGASLNQLLNMIAQQHGLNVIADDEFNTRVSVTLSNVPLEDALDSILSVTGYTWTRQRNIITITRLDSLTASPLAQGRIVRVINLNFVAADEVTEVVSGLLSPVGKTFSNRIDATDNRKTRESIVIEDLPEYVARVEQYIHEIDQPPRQVMVEAHVLQINLSDSTQHGIDLTELTNAGDTKLNLQTQGFNPGTNPSLLVGIDGANFDAVLQALKTTTTAKTLASPKVLVLNGQESRIQIGGQLGFLQSTTTETATLQNVQFIEVGVVLSVTPHISDDGRILLAVKPEVSSGRINPDTGLPEEETTEVETTVMLRDGQGMVIGGLIKEDDIDDQSKVPLLGDAFAVGRLFQRRGVTKERNEVIIALIPRIVPYDASYQPREDIEMDRATTPLMDSQLRRNYREWEPRLNDAIPNEGEVALPSSYERRFNPDEHFRLTESAESSIIRARKSVRRSTRPRSSNTHQFTASNDVRAVKNDVRPVHHVVTQPQPDRVVPASDNAMPVSKRHKNEPNRPSTMMQRIRSRIFRRK